METLVNRIIKILIAIGSLLFLAGAIAYILKYDVVGLYVYLFCAIFFVLGSVVDIIYYEYQLRHQKDANVV
jgi:hypothetical protein